MTADGAAGPSPERDEFYVLYLPMPRRLGRFAWTAIIGVLALMFGAALLLGSSQPDPGSGVWSDSTIEEITGVLAAAPYAVLFPDGTTPAVPMLVVEAGKHGGRPRADAFHARHVRLRGTMLRREGRTLIELTEGSDAITPVSGSNAFPELEPLHQTTIRGEIVDAKCWHGAMKPGDGRAHKACAALCIRGGVAPVLVSQDADAGTTVYLLTSPDGGPLDDRALDMLAEPVDVQGEIADWRGLPVIRVRPAGIRRQ